MKNKTIKILKQLNWDDIFDNSSQYENLYHFLTGYYGLDAFIEGFYAKSKNKRIVKNNLSEKQIPLFKKHAKRIWNMANVQQFHNGEEKDNIQEYLNNL